MNQKSTAVFAIGRWMPIHLGHKSFLVKLAKTYDRLIIGIGSCYENGTHRNCIPAVEREKLLRKMLKTEGVENAVIIPVEDRETFEQWIEDVCTVCRIYGVTHFCTGNREDILDVLQRKGIRLDVEMINPEEGSDFPYHATDVRNAILAGETEKLDGMIPAEIKPMVLRQVAREIRLAAQGKGQEFVPGRQTVDLVFTVRNKKDGKHSVLTGMRNGEKIDFPNTLAIPGSGIRPFESPTDAAVRCFEAETGIRIEVTDNSEEPAKIRIPTLGIEDAEMYFTGIYASRDERINGTRGGGSQCFAVKIDGDPQTIAQVLHPVHDLENLSFLPVDEVHGATFAYDQKRMVFRALDALNVPYNNGELLAVLSEDGTPTGEGVPRAKAHGEGILHGGSHTVIYRKEAGRLMLLLQRRSKNKDSYPDCLDLSSAGHMEFGSDFDETAVKELEEELGIRVDVSRLTPLFSQSIYTEREFYGKPFRDREINRVYALKEDVKPESLTLQPSEVAQVVWLSEAEIREMIRKKDPVLCTDPQEMLRILDVLSAME